MAVVAFRYITPVRPLPLSAGGDSTHKVEYSDSGIVRILYRVKTWKLNATATLTVTSVGEVTTCNWTNEVFSGTYTSELDLQRGSQIFQNTNLLPTTKTGPGNGSVNMTVLNTMSGALTDAVGYVAAAAPNGWYPLFIITVTVFNSTAFLSGNIQAGVTGGSTGLVTFDGFPWPAATNNSLGTTFSGSAAVVPNTYWPYDPGDGGGPIWDTTTGVQLRNPFAP